MIKINLELPEFDKELNISVTLRKDGEVIMASSSSPEVITEVSREKIISPGTENTISKTKCSNLMNMDF